MRPIIIHANDDPRAFKLSNSDDNKHPNYVHQYKSNTL